MPYSLNLHACQHTLSTHPLHTSPHHTLSTHLSIHPINTCFHPPTQPTFKHPLTPSQPSPTGQLELHKEIVCPGQFVRDSVAMFNVQARDSGVILQVSRLTKRLALSIQPFNPPSNSLSPPINSPSQPTLALPLNLPSHPLNPPSTYPLTSSTYPLNPPLSHHNLSLPF